MRKFYLILSLAFFSLLGCENKLEMILPEGPQGEQGPQGEDGLSAFELWKILNGKDSNTPIEEFFDSLKGKDGTDGYTPIIGANGNWYINGDDTGMPAIGKNGENGVDGITPQIGGDGYWWIGDENTGVPVTGKDGKPGINGVTPIIGTNGNWFIDGVDTGVKAIGIDGQDGKDGLDGQDGEDGVTPLIGWNGNWFIDGVDTGVPAEGKNGKDGLDGIDGVDGVTPHVGTNGNWWFGTTDTGVKAEGIDGIDGNTPSIGENGNWFINGLDSGIQAQGQDGQDGQDGIDGIDGKTSYELWKEAVDAGNMTNKDGSVYNSENTWEAYLEWLQGGDISVLHQYWLDQGNTGDLSIFLDALFDCHCDGISVVVFAPNSCINLDSNGDIITIPSATLTVTAEEGSKVQISGDNITTQDKTVGDGDTDVKFTISRSDEDKFVLITVTSPDSETSEQITKNARIPALLYVKFDNASVTKVEGEEKDIASITFETAPKEFYVDYSLVYDKTNGIVTGSDWEVSQDGKTFTKVYERGASVQNLSFRAKGDDDGCSILNDLLAIPQLTPVNVADNVELNLVGCTVEVVLTGTEGMTVKAKPTYSGAPEFTLVENSPGVYAYSDFPRKFSSYDINLTASKEGAGTVTKKVVVDGTMLLPSTPFSSSVADPGNVSPSVTMTLNNPNDKDIEIVLSRGNNSKKGKERSPWIEGATSDTLIVSLAANTSIDLSVNKDVADDFSNGYYTITMETTSFCGESYKSTKNINNQRDFGYEFKKITDQPEGYPSDPSDSGSDKGGSYPNDPDYSVPQLEVGYTIFEFIVEDAIPNSYVQFLLSTSNGFGPVWTGGAKQTDENGDLKILIKMKDTDIALANGHIGEIKLSEDKISSEFLETKEITFNLQ